MCALIRSSEATCPRDLEQPAGWFLCGWKPRESLASRDDEMKLTKLPKLEASGVEPVEGLDLATPTFTSDERVPRQSG